MKVWMLATLVLSLLFVGPVYGQHQGVYGQVFWLGADDGPESTGAPNPENGVAREIDVYPVIVSSQVTQTDGFYNTPAVAPVATTWSKGNGSFRVRLPAGEYSLFVREPKGLYANLVDDEGRINYVKVAPHHYTWVTLTVDYAMPQ